ncbi:hypothetical protein CEXT_162941 [Caerostris extrusa]|uniref:Uncharacterized protein n=1 Tax=Caerostris extrusa TaxID=172846 RepID=A0AAV4TFZ5_CAEEX|nr:hypothetical protein CEXT_162941 [Caerostris extrusa]
MKAAVKPHQTVTLGCCKGTSTNACGFSVVHSARERVGVNSARERVGVNSSREREMRFICPKHSVKPIVLLFHLIEYQIRKTSARVEVRRFQFLLMLQLVWIPFQSYSQCFPDTAVRHSCLPSKTSRALHSHVQQSPTWIAPFAPLSWQQQRLLKDVHFFDVTPKNL